MKKKLPFREYHLVSLLEAFDRQAFPLDFFMHTYFRSHKALGSKDRGFIAETVYALVRWEGLLRFLSKGESWEALYSLHQGINLKEILSRTDIPPHIRVSFPPELFSLLADSYGEERAMEICLASNGPAPTTIRANRLKISRDDLLALLPKELGGFPTKLAADGITFSRRSNFFQLPQFKEGLFEVQDEGSQLVAAAIDVKPGDLVLDYCSGAGGKALAIAACMNHRGQIYLHDIRKRALLEARKRLKRAGIQNGQIVSEASKALLSIKKKMDFVLVDAPCSGTGTLRRNPDMKRKFSLQLLKRLIGQQRMIFEKALSYLKPGGKIVYATCSILKEENEEQVAHFLKTYPLELISPPFVSFPSEGEMDGFFAATFQSM